MACPRPGALPRIKRLALHLCANYTRSQTCERSRSYTSVSAQPTNTPDVLGISLTGAQHSGRDARLPDDRSSLPARGKKGKNTHAENICALATAVHRARADCRVYGGDADDEDACCWTRGT